MPTSPSGSGARSAASRAGARPARKSVPAPAGALLQLRGRFLEFLVFDQLPNQVPARIVFVGIFFRRLLIDRQQAAAFQVNQVRRHDDELARDIDVQLFERLQIFQVLPGDPLERNLVDVELVALDQVKQQIERTLEDLELDLVVAFHAAPRILGRADCESKRARLPP